MGVLKDPGDNDASSFDDPVYKKWVEKAIKWENTKNNGAKYVVVWKDGGYRSYSDCPNTDNIPNANPFKINTDTINTNKIVNTIDKYIDVFNGTGIPLDINNNQFDGNNGMIGENLKFGGIYTSFDDPGYKNYINEMISQYKPSKPSMKYLTVSTDGLARFYGDIKIVTLSNGFGNMFKNTKVFMINPNYTGNWSA